MSSAVLCHLSKVSTSITTDSMPSINSDNIGYMINFFDHYFTNLVVPIKDVASHVVPIVKDLGFNGRVILKRVKNVDYVIIKGLAGQRDFLTGIRYLCTHPKIVQLAIGRVGLSKTVRAGGRLSMYLTIGIELLNLIFGDKEIRECGISIASDLVKIGVSTVIAEAVGLAAAGSATIGAIAAGPIILTIVVGVMTAYALDYFDSRFNITNKVVALMEQMAAKISAASEKASEDVFGNIYQGLRYGIYRATGGFDVGSPVQLR